MDQVDRRLIELLLEDGRAAHQELSRAVHLSRPAVHERVRRLEQSHVITGYAARVDWSRLGLPVIAFVSLRFGGARCATVADELREVAVPGAAICEAYRITGDYCMLLKVRAASTLALQDLLDAIRELPGVVATQTTVALSTVLEGDPQGSPPAAEVPAEPARTVKEPQALNGRRGRSAGDGVSRRSVRG